MNTSRKSVIEETGNGDDMISVTGKEKTDPGIKSSLKSFTSSPGTCQDAKKKNILPEIGFKIKVDIGNRKGVQIYTIPS